MSTFTINPFIMSLHKQDDLVLIVPNDARDNQTREAQTVHTLLNWAIKQRLDEINNEVTRRFLKGEHRVDTSFSSRTDDKSRGNRE